MAATESPSVMAAPKGDTVMKLVCMLLLAPLEGGWGKQISLPPSRNGTTQQILL